MEQKNMFLPPIVYSLPKKEKKMNASPAWRNPETKQNRRKKRNKKTHSGCRNLFFLTHPSTY
jgi:hypothetical protein